MKSKPDKPPSLDWGPEEITVYPSQDLTDEGDVAIVDLYKKEMAKFPLLKHGEQMRLFQEYHDSQDPVHRDAAREKLISHNLRLIKSE